jgi:hypothetical protein
MANFKMIESNNPNITKAKSITQDNNKNNSHDNICYHCSEVNDRYRYSSYCCNGCEKAQIKLDSYDIY